MTLEKIKKKGLKGVKTVIYGRTLFVIAAFLIQFAMMISVYLYLRDYSLFVYVAFIVLGILVVLHLFNNGKSPDFKMVWMLSVLVFPVFGSLFYLYIMTQPGTRLLRKRLDSLAVKTEGCLQQEKSVRENMEAENERMAHFSDYLYRFAHCPVYDRTEAYFYPLGDVQFPDILAELKKAEKFIFLEYFIVEEGFLWNSILEVLKLKTK